MSPRYLVISGLPGSGKTTLARRLGEALQLPVLDKDDVLERLFGEAVQITAVDRHALSRRADDEFMRMAIDAPAAVLVSFWRRPELSTTSGTPTEWLASLPGVVEVFCDCSPEVAVHRFAARSRHPGHGDATTDDGERLSTFRKIRALGPLGLGTVMTVNTDGPVDVDGIAAALATHP